jgi:hypothetical protein
VTTSAASEDMGTADASRSSGSGLKSPRELVRRAHGAFSKCTGDRATRLENPHCFECSLAMTQILIDVGQRAVLLAGGRPTTLHGWHGCKCWTLRVRIRGGCSALLAQTPAMTMSGWWARPTQQPVGLGPEASWKRRRRGRDQMPQDLPRLRCAPTRRNPCRLADTSFSKGQGPITR